MLSKYQKAQAKRCVMLTMQNINKISNKNQLNPKILYYCALNHHTVYHQCQHYAFPAQSESRAIQKPSLLVLQESY